MDIHMIALEMRGLWRGGMRMTDIIIIKVHLQTDNMENRQKNGSL